MYIIEVIPIAILPPQVPQLLSYYFSRPLPKGSVVEISVGNRKVPAAVVSSSGLEERKISLKKSGFQLKKISAVLSEYTMVNDFQFKLALWLSKNYFSSLGLSLKTVLPPFFLKKDYKLQITNYESELNPQSVMRNPIILLSRAGDIIKNIEPEIKKVLHKKKQVMLIVPEISVAENFYEYFAGYYETALIHSKIGPKRYLADWKKISSGDTEIIVGTRQALFGLLAAPGLIIVEDPANESYKSDMSPRYNTSDLALKVADIYNCPVIFVAQLPNVHKYFLVKNNQYELKNCLGTDKPAINIADMVQEIKSGNFHIFSRGTKNHILQYVRNKKKIFIFSSRKGYAGAFMCENCSNNFQCPNCSIPFRYHKIPEPILFCYRCLASQKVPKRCSNCHSYKLKAISFAGTQKIEEEVRRLLSEAGEKIDIFVLDSSAVKNPKAEKEILRKMEESDSFICIATQMMFSHRYSFKFDFVLVPNIDSLTTIPDFKSEEGLFYQFNKLSDFEPKEILVQTYHTENPLLDMLIRNDYGIFYDKELLLRKIFWYPPFARLVKLSFRHFDRTKAGYEARIVSEKLKMAVTQRGLGEAVKILGPSPAFVERDKNYYIYNIILKISPEQRLDEILKFVPSSWIIDVDPKSIL